MDRRHMQVELRLEMKLAGAVRACMRPNVIVNLLDVSFEIICIWGLVSTLAAWIWAQTQVDAGNMIVKLILSMELLWALGARVGWAVPVGFLDMPSQMVDTCVGLAAL